MLRTRENSDVFNSLDEIYLVFTSKEQISSIYCDVMMTLKQLLLYATEKKVRPHDTFCKVRYNGLCKKGIKTDYLYNQ